MLVCLTRAALVTAFNETERGRIWSTELLRVRLEPEGGKNHVRTIVEGE